MPGPGTFGLWDYTVEPREGRSFEPHLTPGVSKHSPPGRPYPHTPPKDSSLSTRTKEGKREEE